MLTRHEINLVKSLSDRRARQEAGLFVAEGMKLVSELSGSGLRIRKLFTSGSFSLPGVECVHASPKEMERLSSLKTSSQVVALVEIPEYKLNTDSLNSELTIALDGVQDPGNLGTIIRVADWFGIKNIICSRNSADCFNSKVVQATMGAIARVKVHYCDLEEVLQPLSTPVYGTFLEGENIYNAKLSSSGIIVMGSEGQGISPGVERLISRKLLIPPYPAGANTSESLNVAMATAIICSEFRRK